MGKYTKIGGQASIKNSAWQQTHAMILIANELAEANRLKRIQLDNDHGYYKSMHGPQFHKLLEDKRV